MQIGSHLAHEPSRVSQVKCSLITAVQSRHVFGFIPRHLCRCEQLQPGVNGLDDESNTEIVTGATVRRVSGLYEKFTLLVSLFQASIWALNRRRGDAHKPDRKTVVKCLATQQCAELLLSSSRPWRHGPLATTMPDRFPHWPVACAPRASLAPATSCRPPPGLPSAGPTSGTCSSWSTATHAVFRVL